MRPATRTLSPAARRAYLQDVIAALARQIASDETPIVDDMCIDSSPNAIDLPELRRLAQLCADRGLPAEAARIRRWLKG